MMAQFTLDFRDDINISVHRVPLSVLETLEEGIGKVGFLDNYPKSGQRIRFVEFRIGSIIVTAFAASEDWEDMPNES